MKLNPSADKHRSAAMHLRKTALWSVGATGCKPDARTAKNGDQLLDLRPARFDI